MREEIDGLLEGDVIVVSILGVECDLGGGGKCRGDGGRLADILITMNLVIM